MVAGENACKPAARKREDAGAREVCQQPMSVYEIMNHSRTREGHRRPAYGAMDRLHSYRALEFMTVVPGVNASDATPALQPAASRVGSRTLTLLLSGPLVAHVVFD